MQGMMQKMLNMSDNKDTKQKIKSIKGPPNTEPDWNGKCDVCGDSPILPATGMCGPCTFGEADTAGGNW